MTADTTLGPSRALHVLAGARRTRRHDDGGETWAHLSATWRLTAPQASMLGAFRTPITLDVVLAAVDDARRPLVLDMAQQLLGSGLLVPLVESGGGAPYATGLFGAPVLPWDQARLRRPTFAVIGVPYDVGVTYRPGARFGPEYVRRAGGAVYTYREQDGRPAGMYDVVRDEMLMQHARLVDLGDIKRTVMTRNGEVFDDVETMVSTVCADGCVPVLVGGDHSVSYPSVQGILRHHPGLTVVHVDAHHDFGEPRTDDHRADLHHGNFMDWLVGDPRVSRVVQLGLRQLTLEPPACHPSLVRVPGRAALTRDVLADIPVEAPVYVTLDVDVLDPAVMPHTGTRLPGGWSHEELLQVLLPVFRERRVVGFDCMELMSGPDETSGLVAASVLLRCMDAWGGKAMTP